MHSVDTLAVISGFLSMQQMAIQATETAGVDIKAGSQVHRAKARSAERAVQK